MAIPTYDQLMLPVLRLAAERGTAVTLREAVDVLGKQFQLTDAELQEYLPSGTQKKFINRVSWAITYLKKAGLLESVGRGWFRVTDRGMALLEERPEFIDLKTLERYPEFVAFRTRSHRDRNDAAHRTEARNILAETSPTETLEAVYEYLRNELAEELLEKLKAGSPRFFEQVVIDLLVKMGYGGSRADAGQAVGKSGDGGIDGIIKEDKLGLDMIYVQAKRWDNTPVGSQEIMKFAGALQAHRATKGVFITTSRFTPDAADYVKHISTKIVLIDGATLARLMIDHDVGVSTIATYPLKQTDNDYFDEGL